LTRNSAEFLGSRVSRAELLGKSFTPDPTFSLKSYAERSFGVFQEPPTEVVWKFSPKSAPDARDYLFHPTQTMEQQSDGSLIVRFRAGGAKEMRWHLATWDGEVEVLEPNDG
jgi:predicted DNA-binding transcriptional regulator YafY